MLMTTKERAGKCVRPRVILTEDNAPHKVTKIQQGKRGKGGGFVKATMKNLISGAVFEKTYSSDDIVEMSFVDKSPMQYSWTDGSHLVLMDTETFEEVRVERSICDGEKYLVEGDPVRLLSFQGRAMGIEIPNIVELEVVSFDFNKASGATHLATLNSGCTMMVPDFIAVGQRIKVNTEDDCYVERA